MSAPQKKTGGWGSLLSQAVAGVEARLDTMLAEEDEAAKTAAPRPSPSKTSSSQALKSSPGPSRSSSQRSGSDRLQERLAKAMAAKAAAQAASSPRRSESSPARSPSTAGPEPTQASPRQSTDAVSRPSLDSINASVAGLPDPVPAPRSSVEVSSMPGDTTDVESRNGDGGKDAQDKPEDLVSSTADLTESSPRSSDVRVEEAPNGAESRVSGDSDSRVKELEKALEEEKLQNQEEIHRYVERIDALESKLQYMSRETTDAARKAALAAPAGSAENKLAEKDQQIAGLMEEGKNLASVERKHRDIMKKLRATIAEKDKEVNEANKARERTEIDLGKLRKQLAIADEITKNYEASKKANTQLRKNMDSLRAEIATRDSTISTLQTKLKEAQDEAELQAAKATAEELEKARRRISELEESVAGLEVEKNLVADRAKTQMCDLKEKAERANERTRAVEIELKGELQMMESKLEAMRGRAEEATSGAVGDSQAKLLRQIENLQAQYAIASENWQTVETTLHARVANLEKERDEAQQRESDMRKKAREAAKRAKHHEEELEETKTKLPTAQQDIKTYQTQLESLKKRAEEAEVALTEARADFDKQKAAWREEKHERTENDRRGWLEDAPSAQYRTNSRPESPLQFSAPQRTLSSDLLGLAGFSMKSRKVSAPSSSHGDHGGDRSRRPSVQPSHRPSVPPAYHAATPPLGFFSPTSELPSVASTPALDSDAFEGVEMSSSPHQVMQDMVSVSTVAAGPSVQLVERMSAAIRRLESEKVGAKEELARISNQRDEARAEIVTLMREVENNKSAVGKVAELEAEVAAINDRYQTTLEMLGEKSELVEELKADVQDVKAMYRDLVESTIK